MNWGYVIFGAIMMAASWYWFQFSYGNMNPFELLFPIYSRAYFPSMVTGAMGFFITLIGVGKND